MPTFEVRFAVPKQVSELYVRAADGVLAEMLPGARQWELVFADGSKVTGTIAEIAAHRPLSSVKHGAATWYSYGNVPPGEETSIHTVRLDTVSPHLCKVTGPDEHGVVDLAERLGGLGKVDPTPIARESGWFQRITTQPMWVQIIGGLIAALMAAAIIGAIALIAS